MSETVYNVQAHYLGSWRTLTNIRPHTREEADAKADACRRSMPSVEFRVEGIAPEDIPF